MSGGRYIARAQAPRADVIWDRYTWTLIPQTITVFEDDKIKPVGLVDASGTPIFRVTETVPMGFRK